jgi:hypothetical protein
VCNEVKVALQQYRVLNSMTGVSENFKFDSLYDLQTVCCSVLKHPPTGYYQNNQRGGYNGGNNRGGRGGRGGYRGGRGGGRGDHKTIKMITINNQNNDNKTTTVVGIIVRNENVIIRITIRILNRINQNIRIKMMHIYKVLLRKQC